MLSIRNLSVAYDAQLVLHNLNLDVSQGEILCLLGPSGCGKSTLLRAVTGLEVPQSGNVTLNDESIISMPVHNRGVGLMFQDNALFPHMTVWQNVAFGLKMQRLPRQLVKEHVAEVLSLVGLDGFSQRDVTALSGGEKQRVALARSLAPNPRLLLLDEPLGSLDAALKERLLPELRAIIKQAGLTAIYVTHDQQEAFAIADRVAVMNDGVFEQIDTPQALYARPETVFVAQFLGLHNIILPGSALFDRFAQDADEALLLHPDGLTLASDGARSITASVQSNVFLGGRHRLVVHAKSGESIMLYATQPPIPLKGSIVHIHLDESQRIPLRLSRQ